MNTRYIYPPRPKSKIRPQDLSREIQKADYLWQPKYDGDRCVVIIENGEVSLFSRNRFEKKASKFNVIKKDFANLNLPDGIHCLDGELIESLSLVVLFDVLQVDGKYLYGIDQVERINILAKICGFPQNNREDIPAIIVSEHIALAPHGDNDFEETFNRFIANKWIEGLILRRKDSFLDNYGSQEYEVDWQIRCRRPHKNYRC